jgi:hypothetical protein
LPPRCHYVSGFGLYYDGGSVGVSFGFGLGADCYTFIPKRNFCDPFPHHYYASLDHARALFKESTVINNYVVGDNNTIINQGIDREKIARVSRAEIAHVAIRETPLPKDPLARSERLERTGDTLAIVRPTLPKLPEAGRTLAAARTEAEVRKTPGLIREPFAPRTKVSSTSDKSLRPDTTATLRPPSGKPDRATPITTAGGPRGEPGATQILPSPKASAEMTKPIRPFAPVRVGSRAEQTGKSVGAPAGKAPAPTEVKPSSSTSEKVTSLVPASRSRPDLPQKLDEAALRSEDIRPRVFVRPSLPTTPPANPSGAVGPAPGSTRTVPADTPPDAHAPVRTARRRPRTPPAPRPARGGRSPARPATRRAIRWAPARE